MNWKTEVLIFSVFLFTELGKVEEEQIRGRWQGTDGSQWESKLLFWTH